MDAICGYKLQINLWLRVFTYQNTTVEWRI